MSQPTPSERLLQLAEDHYTAAEEMQLDAAAMVAGAEAVAEVVVLGFALQASRDQVTALEATQLGLNAQLDVAQADLAESQASLAAANALNDQCNVWLAEQAEQISTLTAEVARLQAIIDQIPEPEPEPPAVVPATSAYSLYDALGVNTHFGFLKDGSWQNTDAAAEWVQALGIGRVRQALGNARHVREAVAGAMAGLTGAGLKWTCQLITQPLTSQEHAEQVVAGQLDYLMQYGTVEALEALPGMNEPNGDGKAPVPGEAAWHDQARWGQQALYITVKDRAALAHVKVQGVPLNMRGGPSAPAPDAQLLGDLSMFMDRGDVHLYTGCHDPETSEPARLAAVEPIHPGMPLYVSECGFTTALDRGYTGGAELVSEWAQALLVVKAWLWHYSQGRKLDLYELLDSPPPWKDTDGAVRNSGFGLVRTPTADPATWQGKPAYRALQSLLGLVADVGPSTAEPRGLAVRITSPELDDEGADTLRWELVHRAADDKHLLILWRSVEIYRYNDRTRTGEDLAVDPLPVTVDLAEYLPVTEYWQQELGVFETVDTITAKHLVTTVGASAVVLEIG